MNRRVANLDILRALAATLVLGVHAYALGGRVAPVRARHTYDVPLIALASGVWLFFVISGYVITRPFIDRLLSAQPPPDLRRYALRRALRIYPLYWVVLAAAIAIDGTMGARPWQLVVHVALLNNLVPGREEALFAPAWTLTLEVLFYVSVPVLAALVGSRLATRRSPAEWLARAVLASWALSIVWTFGAGLLGATTTGTWLRFVLPATWQAFCPGILLAIAPHLPEGRLRRLTDRRVGPRLAVVAVVALLAAAILSARSPVRYGVVPYILLTDLSRPLFAVGYGIVVLAALRARPLEGPRGVLVQVGLASYGIYLIHPVVEAFMLRHGLSPVHRNTLPAFAVNLACLLVITIPLALLSWRWLEGPTLRLATAGALRWRRWGAPRRR